MMTLRVRRATTGDVPGMAATLATAFDGDPWIAWIVDAERHRERICALQVSLLASVGVPHGEAWVAEHQDGTLAGAALWLLADRPVPAAAWAQVAAVEAELMGDRHESAMVAAALTRRLRPGAAHHLLASLGVVPPDRGQGVGAALVAPVLERSDRDGVDAYLETSTERNLRFYSRMGFTVTDQVRLPEGGPPVWSLLRRPVTGG